MIFIVIFVTLFVASNAQNSTDALEKFLMDALKRNEPAYFDFEKYGNELCKLIEPIKPNFTAPGRRISEQKCYEYIWEMESRENETLWTQLCKYHRFSQIKDGTASGFRFWNKSPVVFGGRPALYKEFIHMGAIGWKAKNSSVKWVFKCGSTLISDKFLLTAAHCSKLSLRSSMDIVNSEPEMVRLGVVDLSGKQSSIKEHPEDVKIKRFIVHPKYNSTKKYYDIALIESETEVIFTSTVHPACLWSDHDVSDLATEGILTGWGYTEHGSPSDQLQAAIVDFIDTPVCDKLLQNFRNRQWAGFQDHQMCAGNLTGGIDTCQGDSGGPLQVKIPLKTRGKMYWTVAITSFGIRCGQKNRPGVYTRVSSFIDWIEEIVWPSTNISS